MSDPSMPESLSRPFVAAPHASRYFPAAIFEESRQRITRSIERGEGPAILIGATGVGKTMLVEVLNKQFQETMTVALLAGAQLCTRRALLQMVLFQIGLPYRDMDEGELRLSLLKYLQPDGGTSRRILLLVDEAESLPDRLLEELRVLTNIADNGQSLVSLVLIGTSLLEERFADPKLEVFSQRVSSRSYLAPLGREETLQYIRSQIAAAGQEPLMTFTDDGLEAMLAATDGVPRLINQLGDQLFWMAQETGYNSLDAEIVQQAWSELQQLPAPWNTPDIESIGSAVEFGELALEEAEHATHEESDDEMPASIPMSISHIDELETQENRAPISATFATTEDLLAQLNQLDKEETSPQAASAANKKNPTAASPAKNPFLEQFDSEECLLDPYSKFESLLLSSAPKVVNRHDTFFAQQLQQFEIAETPTITTSANENHKDDSIQQPLPDESSECATMTEIPVEVPGDLLVVEEEFDKKIEVVPGNNFRQLFSSLQVDNQVPNYG